MKPPGTLVQFPFTLHGLLKHSSISGKGLGVEEYVLAYRELRTSTSSQKSAILK